jgi:hypothetical protein
MEVEKVDGQRAADENHSSLHRKGQLLLIEFYIQLKNGYLQSQQLRDS